MSKIQKTSDLFTNKELTDNSQLLRKSSIERFGDDLTELIVSYLSISDKIRLECLSKQIQALIFNRQKCLRISHVKSGDNLEEMISKTSRYHSVDCRALGSVLKKFKNLDTIRIEGRMTVDSELIETIAENANHLKNLWINVRFISDITTECLKSLGQKCGSTLQSLKFDGLTEKQMRQLLSLTPELRSITVDNIKSVVSDAKPSRCRTPDDAKEEKKPFLPKLQEIQFCRCNSRTLNQFQIEYKDQIQKVITHLLSFDLMSDNMTRALTGFGYFRRLRVLDLFIDVVDTSHVKSIDNGLKQLAEKLKDLQQLTFTLDGNLLQNNNLFSVFSSFKSLSSLEISITADQDFEADFEDNPIYNYGSIRDLRHLSQLKHLSLTLEQLSDDCLMGIDRYLPQLLSIRLNSSKAITDKSLQQLSQMKRLSKLEVICYTAEEDQNITDSGVRQLIDCCPRLQSLTFDQKNSSFDFDITEESIESIVKRAERFPKIQFIFSFAVYKNEKSVQLFNRLNNLPQNLTIEIM